MAFTGESRKVRDEKGHSYPGDPHAQLRTITRVRVDGGPDGYCPGGVRAANDLADEYLTGADPLERERSHRFLRRSGRLNREVLSEPAVSRIDCALWDVAGKRFDEPVDPLDDDGRVPVPTDPGLGHAYDWDYVADNRVEL